MFLRNSWYVVGWSKDVESKPVAVRVLDEPIVIYRGHSGQIVALEDHCPHRHVPLSLGKVIGDTLRCGYHGLTFDGAGKCVDVPSQTFIPPKACVKSYPVSERYGWVWIWMGGGIAADEELIPDFHFLSDERYRAVGDTTPVASSYRFVVDNLLDLSHVGFVHVTTIGAAGMGEKGQLRVEKTARGVEVRRLVPNVAMPPVYERSGLLPVGKMIDRFQFIEFVAPCFVMIHVGGAEAGTGVLEGRTEHGLNNWIVNAATPVTETTTMYFWAHVRAHALDDAAADKLFFEATTEAFKEDKQMVEAQQRMVDVHGDSWPLALRADAGSIEARRVNDKLIKAEKMRDTVGVP